MGTMTQRVFPYADAWRAKQLAPLDSRLYSREQASMAASQRLPATNSYSPNLQKNSALLKRVELDEVMLADAYETIGVKQRMIGQFEYVAGTWGRGRHVIVRLEHDARGANPRLIVTSLHGNCVAFYMSSINACVAKQKTVSRRGSWSCSADAPVATSSSPSRVAAPLAYTLMVNLRRLALHGMVLQHVCTADIRVKLLKIGGTIVRNTRPVINNGGGELRQMRYITFPQRYFTPHPQRITPLLLHHGCVPAGSRSIRVRAASSTPSHHQCLQRSSRYRAPVQAPVLPWPCRLT